MSKTFALTISGRVQHVGFRYFAYNEASSLMLEGYVKNLENGDVKIEVQGQPGELDIFLATIRKGPAWARVDEMKIQELPEGNYNGFKIV